MASRLLELFVEISTRGTKELDRDLARLEKRGAAAEKSGAGVGSGYERGAKRAKAAVEGLSDSLDEVKRSSDVNLDIDTSGVDEARVELQGLKQERDALDGTSARLGVDVAGVTEAGA